MKLLSEFVERVLPVQISTAVRSCENAGCRRVVRTSGILGRSRQSVALNGKWFCSPACSEPELRRILREVAQRRTPASQYRHRIPLGLLLLSRQQITSKQLQQAMARQQMHPGKMIGECLVELEATTEHEVTAAVAAQWGCGIFSASLPTYLPADVPAELLRYYGMMPAHWNDGERILHVGFVRRVDYLALAALESLLRCRAEACFIAGSQFRRALAGIDEHREDGRAAFGCGMGTAEIAQIIFSYAEQIAADEIRVAATAEFIWVRLLADSAIDLTFRLQ